MNQLRTPDRLLLAILLPSWLLCFALCLRSATDPRGFPPIYFSSAASPEDHPVVSGIRFGEETPLRSGDRLIRFGETELRGARAFEALAVFLEEQTGTPEPVATLYERDGERRETALPQRFRNIFRWLLPASLVFAGVAVVLLLRARPSPMLRAFFLAWMADAFYLASFFHGSRAAIYASMALQSASLSLSMPLSLRAFRAFPDGRLPTSRAGRLWPWAFAVAGPLHASRFGFLPHSIGVPAVIAVTLAFFVLSLALLTHNYRATDPIGRRQIRWFLFGVYCAFVPPLLAGGLAGYDARFTPLYVVSVVALAAAPLSLLISIARYNLFDVDRLISTATSYNVLLLALVAGTLLLVPWLSDAASTQLGLAPQLGQVTVALLLAALLLPAQGPLRSRIEGWFFPERHAFDLGSEALTRALSSCSDAATLTHTLAEGIRTLVQPEACVVYARDKQSYTPVFAVGRGIPPALEAEGRLIAALRERRRPLALGGSRRWGADLELGPFDRAALEGLDAAAVAPVWHQDEIRFVLCLGPKQSGDVYTPTDIRLLASLAEKASARLQEFDNEAVIGQAQEMHERLRRYVPDAVARQLAEGGAFQEGEREVSVLFADIRGYSSWAEQQPPAAVFALLNRYTEAVTEVIRRRGGSLVDFSGDGVMAVFGTPVALPDKERAAVETALEIGRSVARVLAEGNRSSFAVGVGVSTGPAFVGNIRSADRLIWAVVGTTTNLAARLQQLTRELDASIVIDARTWAAAGPPAAEFARHAGVAIRGQRAAQDVYVARLAPA